MAKQVNCDFCGKELTKSFIGGEAKSFCVGDATFVTCCDECLAKYSELGPYREKRFGAKLINYKKANKTKKLSSSEIAKMYAQYVADEEERKISNNEALGQYYKFFLTNADGKFFVKERAFDVRDQDYSLKKMAKSISKTLDINSVFFDKSDITKIEYAQDGHGDPVGLFTLAYSFIIRLNDEKVLTYKPCITRDAVIAHGFLFFGFKKSAEKHLLYDLNEFKKAIGSDLPIVKVKKIK